MLIEALFFGLLGLIVGSFLNVVILRRGARTLGGRSGCMACGTQLRWYDMLPVLSWIALYGRCRSCRAWISVQYPLVEALTAALFILIGLAPIDVVAKALSLCIAGFLVIIAVYDLRHTIIPDEWAYSFAALAFIGALSTILKGEETNVLLTLCAGPLTAFPLGALWGASRGRWMGLGDPKLALGIGWLLGVNAGLYAVFLAFVIGAVVSIFVLLPFEYLRHAASGITRFGFASRRFTMKSEVPFGPFLIASCIIVWAAMLYGLPLPFFA